MFKVGDRVKVIKYGNKYEEKYLGKEGIITKSIKRDQTSYFTVKFDTEYHSWCFYPHEIVLVSSQKGKYHV